MSFKLDYNASSIKKNIDKMQNKLGVVIFAYTTTKAKAIEADMKSNRVWTDRTGMAKATLNTKVSSNGNVVRITLAHGVDYGVWLELANEKNFAIIAPTVEAEAPRIIEDLNDIMSQLHL